MKLKKNLFTVVPSDFNLAEDDYYISVFGENFSWLQYTDGLNSATADEHLTVVDSIHEDVCQILVDCLPTREARFVNHTASLHKDLKKLFTRGVLNCNALYLLKIDVKTNLVTFLKALNNRQEIVDYYMTL